jgi:hypothetical protein
MQLNKNNYFYLIKLAQYLGIKIPWFMPRRRALAKLKKSLRLQKQNAGFKTNN